MTSKQKSTSLNVLLVAGMTSLGVAPVSSGSRDAVTSPTTWSRENDCADEVKKRVAFWYRSSVCWITWVMTSQRGTTNFWNLSSESTTLRKHCRRKNYNTIDGWRSVLSSVTCKAKTATTLTTSTSSSSSSSSAAAAAVAVASSLLLLPPPKEWRYLFVCLTVFIRKVRPLHVK